MGPSGSGKSTLLTIAGGLDAATSGEAFVFQDLNLIPALTAAENVALPRELDGASARQARREAIDALAELGLGDLADRFPDDMSGGQQQRAAIARALIGPPPPRARRRADRRAGLGDR
jgi:putative ABC transport system ATP-binding protein